MQTRLADFIRDTPDGRAADAILRKCVHCGFCTATCPTYQLLGDELDGPRGRIYLVKQLLEGANGYSPHPDPSRPLSHVPRLRDHVSVRRALRATRGHRTPTRGRTCPPTVHRARQAQGVALGHPPSLPVRAAARRWAACDTSPASRCARPQGATARARPVAGRLAHHARRVLALGGCVQGAIAPAIDAAAARVLEPARHQLHPGVGLRLLRGGESPSRRPRRGARDDAPEHRCLVAGDRGGRRGDRHHRECLRGRGQGVRGASRTRPGLCPQGERVSPRSRGISARSWPARTAPASLPRQASRRIAFHSPCTLQHGQKLRGLVEGILQRAGFELTAVNDAHLCCGSAGTYSILQPELSMQAAHTQDRQLWKCAPPRRHRHREHRLLRTSRHRVIGAGSALDPAPRPGRRGVKRGRDPGTGMGDPEDAGKILGQRPSLKYEIWIVTIQIS